VSNRPTPRRDGPDLVLARPRAFSFATGYSLRQWLKGSLWVVPLLGGLAGLGLAALDPWIEATWPAKGGWRYTAETASDMLTAIVGAMVGLLGFVVTISVLVVQMATSTLSPRFMRLWYRDRLQKLVLACFVGTVTFAYSLHRAIREGSVPSVGVTLAGVAFGVSLILLLLYLDRFVHNLRPVGDRGVRGPARTARGPPPRPGTRPSAGRHRRRAESILGVRTGAGGRPIGRGGYPGDRLSRVVRRRGPA
jgi:hypothetical protein